MEVPVKVNMPSSSYIWKKQKSKETMRNKYLIKGQKNLLGELAYLPGKFRTRTAE
jgi:hypothetical protein